MIKLTPADVDCFLRALELAEESPEYGFQPTEIDKIESGWFTFDADYLICGFVFAMGGGRRLYVEYSRDDLKILAEEAMTVEPLKKGERYGKNTSAGPWGWHDQVEHINAALREFRESEPKKSASEAHRGYLM